MKTAKKTKTRTSGAKTTRKAPAGAPAARTSAGGHGAGSPAARAKAALVERCRALGLLEDAWAERLEKLTGALAEGGPDTAAKAAAFDRELYAGLVSFEAQGGDGPAKKSLQPLIAYAEAVASLPGTREGLDQALGALRKVVAFHGASLFVRDPDAGRLDPAAVCGFPVELVPRIRFTEGSGFSSWVASRKKPVLYASMHRNEAPGAEHVRSFMSVPLVVGDDSVGVVNLGHREDGAYGPAELRRLLLAAGVLGGLVQRVVAQRQIRAREVRNPGTGLATARYFRSRLDEEVVRCRELGHAMSLLVLRLRELESLSGQLGEEFREKARADFAALVAEWRLPTELAGHTDGETLTVLLPGVRPERAQARAEALRELVQRHNFPRRKKMDLGWGVANYPADAEDSQDLLACADRAMKEAASPEAAFLDLAQSMAA